jgi:hypothetical protein
MTGYLLSIDGQEIGVYANSSIDAENYAREHFPQGKRFRVLDGGAPRDFELDASTRSKCESSRPEYRKEYKITYNSQNRFKA